MFMYDRKIDCFSSNLAEWQNLNKLLLFFGVYINM